MAFNFSHTQTRIPAGCQEPRLLSSGSMKGLWGLESSHDQSGDDMERKLRLSPHTDWGKASAKPRRSADDSCPTFGSVPQREGSLQPAGLKCVMTRPPNHQRTCDGYHSGQNVFRFPSSFCMWFAANLLDKTRHSRSQLKMHLRFGYMCDAVETHK